MSECVKYKHISLRNGKIFVEIRVMDRKTRKVIQKAVADYKRKKFKTNFQEVSEIMGYDLIA